MPYLLMHKLTHFVYLSLSDFLVEYTVWYTNYKAIVEDSQPVSHIAIIYLHSYYAGIVPDVFSINSSLMTLANFKDLQMSVLSQRLSLIGYILYS